MIPVTTGILIVLLKFPRGICSTVYLLMNGVVKKYLSSLFDTQGTWCSPAHFNQPTEGTLSGRSPTRTPPSNPHSSQRNQPTKPSRYCWRCRQSSLTPLLARWPSNTLSTMPRGAKPGLRNSWSRFSMELLVLWMSLDT